MNPRTRYILIALAALASATLAAATIATTRAATGPLTAGSVSGKVTSESEVPLSEMVVYLEPDGVSLAPTADEALPKAQIRQKGAKFDPPLLIISVGQTVDFLNDEDRPVEHNVFSNAPAKKFDLGLYPPPQTKSVTFDKPGAVFLYCSIHRFMDGVVYVCPTRLHSRVAPDGTFKIEHVPPGKYKLKTWQRRKRFPEKAEALDLSDASPHTMNLELRRP